jgi:hypothetical protein
MRTFYIPVMLCEKMAFTDLSFRQHAVIEFLVKERNSAGVIHERPSETKKQSVEWHHITSPKKEETCNRTVCLKIYGKCLLA